MDRDSENKSAISSFPELDPTRTLDLEAGTVKLLNKVIETKATTIFFLDKSARPISWIFRDVWARISDRKLLPPDLKLPEIRYINVGRDQDLNKFSPNSREIALAREQYKIPPDGPILVVDELRDTGETLDRSANIINSLFPGREIIKHVALLRVPFWYGNGELIGVEEKSVAKNGSILPDSRIWSFPLTNYDSIVGGIPADRTKHQLLRQALRESISIPLSTKILKTKDGRLITPQINSGFNSN